MTRATSPESVLASEFWIAGEESSDCWGVHLSLAEFIRFLILDTEGLGSESSDNKGRLHCSHTVI